MIRSSSCPKAGIHIRESDIKPIKPIHSNKPNTYNPNYIPEPKPRTFLSPQSQLSKPVSFHNTTLDKLDLDLNNYSLNDLYTLFNIEDNDLTVDTLKQAKQVVLKMHPDKSRLEPKFFLFFSSAYKKLKEVYDFQNKSYTNKKYVDEDFFEEGNKELLNNMFQKPEFKDTNGKGFNKWFNDAFEKSRLEDPNAHGYQDWLKSDDGFMSVDENVTQSNMNEIFERQKKQLQDVIVYKGITDSVSSSSIGGSLFGDTTNYSSGIYTDLRQAYTETLIPVTEEDYNKMHKFASLNEYKSHRDRVDVTPLSESDATKMLYDKKKGDDHQSASLAYKYALESEQVKKKQNGFWSDLKKLTNF